MKADYFEFMINFEKYAQAVENEALKQFDWGLYRSWVGFPSQYFNEFVKKMKIVLDIIKMLGVSSHLQQSLDQGLSSVRAPADRRDEIIKRFDFLIQQFQNNRTEILANLNKLSDTEKVRLSEAIYTLNEGCYHSSIVMSAVAIESRLRMLMERTNPSKLNELRGGHPERAPLGALINWYLDHKESFNNVVPSKHEKPLKLLNSFRIFSAHPKEEELNWKNANAVLNLTFDFLLDTG